jgi:prepilin signal peptidase PulO-like enzyme (type II secretory pathway)
MDTTQLIIWIGDWMPVLWVFAFGACVGSLLNVLAYRLPLGLDCVSPSSRCPSCDTKLTWRENIPIFGWLMLRGKCRFCRSKISPQYPIVEAFVAFLWAGTYALWFVLPSYGQGPFGIHWASVKPEWTRLGVLHVWPIMLVFFSLFSCLVAMTLTDLKSYTIPLVLPWFATAFGAVTHTAFAVYVSLSGKDLAPLRGTEWPWSLATPAVLVGDAAAGLTTLNSWWWIGASIGGIVGIGVGLLLLRFKLIGRSFEDYQAWEDAEKARRGLDAVGTEVPAAATPLAAAPSFSTGALVGRFTLLLAAIALGFFAGLQLALLANLGDWKWLVAPVGSILFGAVAVRLMSPELAPPKPDDPTELWIAYPHARREMVKELAFLAPFGLLGWLGGTIATKLVTRGPEIMTVSGSAIETAAMPPLWLNVLCGTLIGYLVGGGIVWLVRILGSLGFQKEAMGLGDVHLLAAAGACLGWIDSILAFFTAAFVGLFGTLIARAVTAVRTGRRGGSSGTLPFGPSLAIACGIVVLFKPIFEWGLTRLLHSELPVNIP